MKRIRKYHIKQKIETKCSKKQKICDQSPNLNIIIIENSYNENNNKVLNSYLDFQVKRKKRKKEMIDNYAQNDY